MIKLKDLLSERKYTELWYGGPIPDRLPIFVTTHKESAKWYSENRPHSKLYKVSFNCNNPFEFKGLESAKLLKSILSEVGIDVELNIDSIHGWTWQCNSVQKHSDYDGDNPFDVCYIPKARQALIKNGYDSMTGMDVIERHEIYVYIAIKSLNQVNMTNELI